MKWILRNALIVVVLATIATPGFSRHAHVISGIDAARNYHGKSSKKLYIRAGSFSSESNARQAAIIIRANTTYPVTIARIQGYHVVTIGPIASAADVRKTADHLPTDFKARILRHDKHHASAKSKPVTPVIKTAPAITAKPVVPVAAKIPALEVTPKPEVISKPVVAPQSAVQEKHELDRPTSSPKTAEEATSSVSYQFAHIIKMPSLPSNWKGSFFLSAGAGDLFNRVEGDNLVATGPGWPSDHYLSNDVTDQPYFSLAGGYMLARPTDWLPSYSLGLRMMYASTSTVSGSIDQYSLPDFKNYDFKYDIQLLSVLATLKVDLYRWKNLMPYLMGGVGMTNYSTSQYTEQALSGVTPRVSPAYGSNSGNNFSYALGVGVDYAIFENVWINGEFNYMDFGSVATGKGQNYATLTGTNYNDQSLKNKISATSVFLGLTFLVS